MMTRCLLAAVMAATTLPPARAQTTFPPLPEGGLLRDCGAPDASEDICRVPEGLTAAEADQRLGDEQAVLWREGDRLRLVARNPAAVVGASGSISAPMARIEQTDLWSLTISAPRLDEAVVDVFVTPPMGELRPLTYRGPLAPPPPPFEAELLGRVVFDEIDSPNLGETRQIVIYTPPEFDPVRRYPTVYVADGTAVAFYARIIEPAILSGRLPPMVVIGLEDGAGQRRSVDYLIGWREGEGFEAHEDFLIQEVMPRAESLYGATIDPAFRVVMGKSSGAAWALDTALRNPDLFGAAIVMALGYRGPRSAVGIEAAGRPRLFMATGLFDPFITRSRQIAERASRSSDDLVYLEPVSGHGDLFYQALMVDALAWAFSEDR